MKCTKEHRLSFTEKAKKIVDSLTLEEKVSLMSGSCTLQDMITEMQENPDAHYNHKPYRAGGIEEKGIPPMLFCDGPRGVVCGMRKAPASRYPCCAAPVLISNWRNRSGKQ